MGLRKDHSSHITVCTHHAECSQHLLLLTLKQLNLHQNHCCFFFSQLYWSMVDNKNCVYLRYGLRQWLRGKESTCNARATGDVHSIPGLRRSPGGGHGNTLQYSCLENPRDKGAWWAAVHGGSQRVGHDWSDLAHIFKVYSGMVCYMCRLWNNYHNQVH